MSPCLLLPHVEVMKIITDTHMQFYFQRVKRKKLSNVSIEQIPDLNAVSVIICWTKKGLSL